VQVKEKLVYINGQPLPEHQIVSVDHEDDPNTDAIESNGPLEIRSDPPRKPGETYNVYYSLPPKQLDSGFDRVVPAKRYSVTGDNRNNNADGRVRGFVTRELIIGRHVRLLVVRMKRSPSAVLWISLPIRVGAGPARW
jgi:hypothetical protein